MRLLGDEGGKEFGDEFLEGFIRLLGDLTVLSDGSEEALVTGLDVLGEVLLECGDLCGVQLVEVTADTTVDDGDLRNRGSK